jgi:hypothetical protein
VPYVITTKRGGHCETCGYSGPDQIDAVGDYGGEPYEARCGNEWHDSAVSRRAVATLEEARRGAFDRLQVENGAPEIWDAGEYQSCIDDVERISGSGGTITLPDGTVIEVGEVDWGALMLAAGMRADYSYTEQQILHAYNARQA